MVRPVPHDRARARRDFRRHGRQSENRQTERRRESEDGLEIRRDVDPDADDLQGRRDGLAPGRRRTEAEAAAVDHGCGLIDLANNLVLTAGAQPAVLLRHPLLKTYPGGVPLMASTWPARY